MSNNMKLPDGPGWSPDGGEYWVKGDLLYWQNGHIWDMRDGGVIRVMPSGYIHENDYSALTDEARAKVVADWTEQHEKRRKQERLREERRDLLRESARTKLSAEEIEACDLECI